MLQLQYAIQSNENAIFKCHNHPIGNVQPSESDIAITRKIKESGIVMDIQLLDHLIIVPEGSYYSMGDEGIV
jgi:DNA repair protein RadC